MSPKASIMKARDLIIDGHEDIAFNSLYLHRDFLLAAHDKRQDRVDDKNGNPTVGLPDLIKGNVRIVFATIWVPPCLPEVDEKPCYSTAEEAYDLGRQQLDYYETLASQDHITLIRTQRDLESVVQNRTRVGLLLLMEGADPIMAPENASDWYLDGLRIVAPSWRATRYAGGTHMPGPLTHAGRELMRELERANLVLDVSHMTDEGFFEALERFHGTVIASHSNCRALVPTERHLSDEMIRALVSRDGVIGIVFNNPFLLKDWEQIGHVKSQVTLKQVVQHIQHVCAIAGDTRHVAIGSDLDGGFGVEKTPAEVDTVSDLWKLGHALSSEGFSDEDVQGILHGNWLRVLEGALPP
jgi:membrane dipeptidase